MLAFALFTSHKRCGTHSHWPSAITHGCQPEIVVPHQLHGGYETSESAFDIYGYTHLLYGRLITCVRPKWEMILKRIHLEAHFSCYLCVCVYRTRLISNHNIQKFIRNQLEKWLLFAKCSKIAAAAAAAAGAEVYSNGSVRRSKINDIFDIRVPMCCDWWFLFVIVYSWTGRRVPC